MTRARIYTTILMCAGAGAIGLAQAPAATRAAGTVTAHADIKGDGITGTADLTERKIGTGIVVDITVRRAD